MDRQEQLLILEEYKKIEGILHDISKDFIDEYLYEIDKAGIHSYRYRTKDPEHLLEKIERKQRENPQKFAGMADEMSSYFRKMKENKGDK